MSTPLARAGLAVAGFAAAGLLMARMLGVPWPDAYELVRNSLAPSLLVAVSGATWMARRPHPTLRAQSAAAALVLVSVVVAGVIGAAASMFISTHDFRALLVVATVATGVALGLALQFGSRVGEDAAAVERALRDPTDDLGQIRLAEMHELAGHLRAASIDLAESQQREQAVERSRRELVAWISHDLRSPLASIRALAEALEDGIVTESADVDRYFASIRRETERLTTLVDDLFELSRVHAGAVAATVSTPVPITEVVEDAIGGVRGLAAAKQVEIVCRRWDTDDLAVPAADVARIVRNLLDNAVRHTPSGGSVHVDLFLDAAGIRLQVADECGGIPTDELPRVFDVAYRGDAARQRRDDSGGGGLGLAIARGLAQAHTGDIDVANTGPGCRFELRMPRTPDHAGGARRLPQPEIR